MVNLANLVLKTTQYQTDVKIDAEWREFNTESDSRAEMKIKAFLPQV